MATFQVIDTSDGGDTVYEGFVKDAANWAIAEGTIISGYTSTATAAGTTTLTVGSNYQQFFTGTTTHTVKLPVTSTLNLGHPYRIVNKSTGVVTVTSSGDNSIVAMVSNSECIVTCILASGTTAASWDVEYSGISAVTGTGSMVLATSPTLVTPALGTPSAIVLTNASGTVTNLTLVTPTLGTPSSGTLTNCTGLPTSGVTGIQGQWTQTTGTFTATPASTSTITMTTDLTATVLAGMGLKYVIGGVTYYGQVSAIAANLLTVRGAALGGDVTALYYGGGVVSQLSYDATVNVDCTANTTALKTGTVYTLKWQKPKSYLVFYQAYQTTHDSGTHGKVTIKINGTEVNTSAGGLVIAANATWYSTVVDIATAAYDINPGEDLIIYVTEGTTVDGAGLAVGAIILTP